MRILIGTCVTPATGGVASHINMLADALRARGHEVVLLTPLGEFHSFRLVGSVPLELLGRFLRIPGGMLSAYWIGQAIMRHRLARAIGEHDFDVVNVEDVSAMNAFLSVNCSIRPPVVLTVHGYLAAEAVADSRTMAGSTTHALLLNQERRAYSHGDIVVACDQRLACHVESLGALGPGTVHVVRNFVDTERFNPRAAPGGPLREQMGIGCDDFVVLCPRRLVPKNGVLAMVEAIPRLLQLGLPRPIKMLLAGEGYQANRIRDAARRLGIDHLVIVLGSIPNSLMPRFYLVADAVVIPSVTVSGVAESSSIAALEAMACGRPVVASGIGGLREVIRNGETGLLVPEGDSEALASALAGLAHHPEVGNRIGLAAARFVEKERSSRAAAEAFLRLYREAAQSYR